jgi:hypothetical protein
LRAEKRQNLFRCATLASRKLEHSCLSINNIKTATLNITPLIESKKRRILFKIAALAGGGLAEQS